MEYLLHPDDHRTGVQYRLLPMSRGMISGMFTPEQMRQHLALIEEHLLFPDGARLMNRPMAYRGGTERLFKRAESAANFGREIGLLYTHAHIRYVEAMARMSHPRSGSPKLGISGLNRSTAGTLDTRFESTAVAAVRTTGR